MANIPTNYDLKPFPSDFECAECVQLLKTVGIMSKYFIVEYKMRYHLPISWIAE
jgi:hypothetical protein